MSRRPPLGVRYRRTVRSFRGLPGPMPALVAASLADSPARCIDSLAGTLLS